MKEVKVATFITAPMVRELAKNDKLLKKLKERFRELNISKVYIENYRSGVLLTHDILEKVRKMFDEEYEVAGGSCIGTWGANWGRYADYGFRVICLNDERNRELLTRAMKELAYTFDEILIDDFWANWCYCDTCIRRFNEIYGFNLTERALRESILRNDPEIMSCWAEYSAQLLAEVSKKYVVKPAKEVNKNVEVVLKVAEWRELFRHRGLFLPKMKEIFDGFYVGTESREGTQRYGSFYIIRLMKALVGDKLRGAWFDTYNGFDLRVPIGVEAYVEQGWLSVLGLVNEITLFHAGSLIDEEREEHMEKISKEIPLMKRLSKVIEGNVIGVLSLSIQSSVQAPFDNYIQDWFGMIGVPLEAVKPQAIKKGDYVLITENDVKYVDVLGLARRGANLIVTASAAELIAKGRLGEEGLDLIGVSHERPIIALVKDIMAFVYNGNTIVSWHRRPYGMPFGPILNIERGEILLHATDGIRTYPAIYRVDLEEGSKVYVLCVTKYAVYMKEYYPEIVRQIIRDISMEYIGVKLRNVGGALFNVGLFPYSDGTIVLANMNNHAVRLDLVIDKERTRIKISKIPSNSTFSRIKIDDVKETEKVIKMRLKIDKNAVDALRFT
ncbi:MAG: hypothetical protein DRZ82_05200 [Thermoprotei archaeon]|nr:MAG: hypothetical protein DRZ82_05200 [Thermoprotei archaeon]